MSLNELVEKCIQEQVNLVGIWVVMYIVELKNMFKLFFFAFCIKRMETSSYCVEYQACPLIFGSFTTQLELEYALQF